MRNLLIILFVLISISLYSQKSKGIVTIKGVASDGKGGSMLYAKNDVFYMLDENHQWTKEQIGKKVKVRAELYYIKNDEEFVIDGTVLKGRQMMKSYYKIVPIKIKVIK